MPGKKSVSIVIPNYNGRRLLEQYLPFTLTAIKNSGAEYEIIVVDDCSKDDSVDYLGQAYPDIIVLKNVVNSGFSSTCNLGISHAGMDLIMLLNSDVKLAPDYFDHLWSYFDRPDTFGVMGRIIDMNGTHIQDAARMPKKSGVKLKTNWFYYLQNDEQTLTFYLSGANAIMDAQKLKAIGGLNTLFSPFYAEDFELSMRAWRLNWTCWYEHRAICEHELSASTRDYKTARWVKMIYFRNRYYLHALHLTGFNLFLWYLQVTIVDLLPKIITGKFWLATSYIQFIKHREEIKQSKIEFKVLMEQHESTTSIADVIEKIVGSVDVKDVVRVD